MKNMGKQIKDLGVLFIVVGVISLFLALFPLFFPNPRSMLYMLADKYFLFLLINGLVVLLAGIITRSIGRSKEDKDKNNKDE